MATTAQNVRDDTAHGAGRYTLLGAASLLVAGGLTILALRIQLGELGPVGALAWAAAFAAVAFCAFRFPLPALALLAVTVGALPYLEPLQPLGKELPAFVVYGVALGLVAALWLQRGEHHAALRSRTVPVALWANLLLVSAVITTLRYSPALAELLPTAEWRGGWLAAAAVSGRTTPFLLQAAAFAVGPVLALVIVWLFEARGDRVREALLAGLVAGLGASLLVALGQEYVPRFPLPSRHELWPSGLMTNPGGLATLSVVFTPVLLALVSSGRERPVVRLIAAVTLACVAAALGPLDAKTAQLGVPLAAIVFFVLRQLMRHPGAGRAYLGRLAAGVAAVAAVGLGVAAVLSQVGVSDWSSFTEEMVLGFSPARMERNRQMLLMIGDHPLAGAGVGSFSMLLPYYFDHYGVVWGRTILEPTNHFLHVAATLGVIGLLAALLVFWGLLGGAYRSLIDGGERAGSATASAGLLAGVSMGLLLSAWQGETFYYQPVAVPFWLLAGILAAGCAAPRRETATPAGLPVLVVAIYGIALLLGL